MLADRKALGAFYNTTVKLCSRDITGKGHTKQLCKKSKLLASCHAGCIEGKFCCLANNVSHTRNVFIACFGPLNFSNGVYESYMYIVKIASGSHHRGNNVQQEFNILATYFTSCVGHR